MIIEAKDFAGSTPSGFHFGGASREQIVAALRKLITGIEDGRVLTQKAVVSTEQGIDDYALTSLTFTYAERDTGFTEAELARKAKEGPPREAALYGGDGKFPVEIRSAQ